MITQCYAVNTSILYVCFSVWSQCYAVNTSILYVCFSVWSQCYAVNTSILYVCFSVWSHSVMLSIHPYYMSVLAYDHSVMQSIHPYYMSVLAYNHTALLIQTSSMIGSVLWPLHNSLIKKLILIRQQLLCLFCPTNESSSKQSPKMLHICSGSSELIRLK